MHVYQFIKLILSLQIFIILIVFFGCCKPVDSKNAVNNKDSIGEPTNDIFHEELSNSHETPHHIGNHSVHRYRVATFDFDHVSTPYIVSLWIIIVGLAKIGESIACRDQQIIINILTIYCISYVFEPLVIFANELHPHYNYNH